MTSTLVHITHLVNPFAAPKGSEHDIAQRITFAAIRRAAERAAKAGVRVQVLAACFDDESGVVEAPAAPTKPLKRSVLDVATFKTPKRFPLIADLLGRADEEGLGEHVVYSNIDISPQPHFYTSVLELLERTPAAVINRRTIPARYQRTDDLDRMYAEEGDPHGGWDCFCFPREWIPRMRFENVCIGAPGVGAAVVANLDALAGWRLRVYADERLTFHIGNDKTWKQRDDFRVFNRRQLRAALGALEQDLGRAPAGSWFDRARSRGLGEARRDKTFVGRAMRYTGVSTLRRAFSSSRQGKKLASS